MECERVRRNESRFPAVAYIMRTCRAFIEGPKLSEPISPAWNEPLQRSSRGESCWFNPGVVVRYDIWMSECLQQSNFAEHLDEVRLTRPNRDFLDGVSA